jgi:DNA-nicking Smr family endonuclease
MGRRQQSRKQRRKCPDFRKSEVAGPQAPKSRTDAPQPPKRTRSKKAIPVLSEKEDLQAAFGVVDEIPSFAEAIDQTLTDPEGRQALHERLESLRRAEGAKKARSLKQYPPPESELDLHGLTGPEAEQRTASFIAVARQKGVQTLRIITGKGLHSQGPAVLPDVVEQLLSELKRAKAIVSFRWEKKEKQKSGAVLVYLPRCGG